MKSISAKVENDITETGLATRPGPSSSATPEILPSGSSALLELLKEAASDTMTYADNCVSELLSQMEEVRSCTESRAPDKMASIAMAARSFAEVMREKTEAMKLLRE
jgi:hypothetical protein